MRKKALRLLLTPIFMAGIFWWHVRNAFATGYKWEKIEMEKK
ncbi:MAG TPA: hypothetical protein VMW10_10805 [Alphaproteobacteria bacterium]|nr:hypothetical protein [Alphaproteobacteria bacterium]